MKHFLTLIVLMIIVGFAVLKLGKLSKTTDKSLQSTSILNQFEKDGVPNFELSNLDEKKVKLSDYKDKLIILNFWASWCEPCIKEFPYMVKLVDELEGKAVFIAVSADDSKQDIKDFLQVFQESSKSKNLVVVWDKDKTVKDKYKLQALPETFIIGKDLKLIRKITGIEDWYNEDSIAFFKSLLSLPHQNDESQKN